MERLETIDGKNWQPLVAAPWGVLVLAKTDCEHCAAYTAELLPWLAADRAFTDVRFGKMYLDVGGLGSFKRVNPWLQDVVDVLPYTLIYRNGDKVAEFAGGGIDRLENRLRRLRAEAAGTVEVDPRDTAPPPAPM